MFRNKNSNELRSQAYHEKMLKAVEALHLGSTIAIPAAISLKTVTAITIITSTLKAGRGLQLDSSFSPVQAAKIAGLVKMGSWVSVKQGTSFNNYLTVAQALRPGTALLLEQLSVEQVMRVARKLKTGCDLLVAKDAPKDYILKVRRLLPKGNQLYYKEDFLDNVIKECLSKLAMDIVESLPKETWIAPDDNVPLTIVKASLKSLKPGSGLILPASTTPKTAKLMVKELPSGCYLSFNKDISEESAIAAAYVLPRGCKISFGKDLPTSTVNAVKTVLHERIQQSSEIFLNKLMYSRTEKSIGARPDSFFNNPRPKLQVQVDMANKVDLSLGYQP